MYFGVQMYGVSKEWKQDPEGFLKKIYEAGYRQIEPCLGFRVDARDYGFWIDRKSTRLNSSHPSRSRIGLRPDKIPH